MTSAELQVVFSFQHSSGARDEMSCGAARQHSTTKPENRDARVARVALVGRIGIVWQVRRNKGGLGFFERENLRDGTLHQAISGLSSVGQESAGECRRVAACSGLQSAQEPTRPYRMDTRQRLLPVTYLPTSLAEPYLIKHLAKQPKILAAMVHGPRAIDECDACAAAATPTPLPAIWIWPSGSLAFLEPWNQPGPACRGI